MSKPAKVLYIADDEADRRAFLEMVREKALPWEVTMAQTLAAARARLNDSRFDVIVADNDLPDGESRELFGEIPDIPFVLVTGTLGEQLALRTLERGADDYVIKDPQQRHLEALPFAVEKTLYRKSIHEREQRLTRELRESEQHLRATFENAASGIAEIDAADQLIAVNDRLCRMLGYAREELLGKSVQELTHPADRPRSDELSAQVHEGGLAEFQHEKRYVKKGGSLLWAHVAASAVRDEAGRYLYTVATVVDISARKAAEERVRLQATALEAAPNAISISETDRQGTIVWVNRAFTALTGYSAEEAIGHSHHLLSSGRQDRTFYRNLWQTIERGEMWRGELTNRRKDGALYQEEMGITPLRDEEGRVTHFVAVKQDITARKQAEFALQESERQLRFVCESIPHMVWAARPDGYVDYLNQRVLDYTGAKYEEMTGWDWLPFIHPDDRQQTTEQWKIALRDGSEVRLTYRMRHGQSGEYRWHAVHALPLRNAEGRITRWYGTCTDIDEQKRAERALAESEAKYRTLFENMAEEVHFWKLLRDEAGRIRTWQLVDVNPATIKTWNRKPDEIRGKTPDEIFGPGSTDHFMPIVQKVMTEGVPHSFEDYFPPLNKSFRFIIVPVGEYFITTGADITQRKQAEEALQLSEQRFRTVAENAQAVVGIVQGQRFVYANPFLMEISGYREDEILAMDFVELVRPDYRQMVADYARRRQLGEAVPRHYEFAMVTKGGETRWIDLSVGPIVYDSRPAIVGTGYDVTNRKRAEEVVRVALVEAQRFREALENVPAYVYMKDLQFRYIYANKLTLELFGCSAEELVGHDDYRFFPPDSAQRLREIDQRVAAGRQSTEEIIGAEIGGQRRVYLEYKTPIYAEPEGKTICGLLGISTDITERKQAEEALRRSEAQFHDLAESMPQLVWITGPEGGLEYVNRQWYQYTGASPEQSKGLGWMKWLHPEDQQQTMELWNRSVGSGEPYEIEYRFRRASDGTYRWLLVRGLPVRDEQGGIMRWFGTCTDIDDQKRAEEQLEQRVRQRTVDLAKALAEAEEGRATLDALLESIPEGITILDAADYRARRVSRYVGQLLDTDTQTLESMTGAEFAKRWQALEPDGVTPVPLEGLPVVQAIQEGRTVQERELVLRRGADKGDDVPILCNAAPIRDGSGHITGGVVAWLDITERKRAEAAVQESEERLRFALETCHIGAWDLDLVDHTAYRSLEHDRIFGYAEPLRQWTFEMFVQHVLPEDRAEVEANFRQAADTQSGWSFECRIRRADGEVRWIWAAGRRRSDVASSNRRMAGVVQDITERKHAEEALQESERLYRAIGESIDYGIWICDAQGRNTYASESLLKLVGITQEQCAQFGWGDVLHPDDREATIAAWKQCVQSGGPWYREHRYRGVDGQWHPILACGVPVRNERGEVTAWVGINLDISRLKQAEQALRESERRLKLAQQAAKIGSFEWSVKTDVNTWSPEMEAMYGLAPGEFGKTEDAWEQLVHPEDRAAIMERVQQAFETGEPTEGEWRVIWPDGSEHWIMGRFQGFKDADGKPLRLNGVNIDITERKRAEAALRELNETLEHRVAERTEALRLAKAEAEQANAAKDHFLAVLSHELRTPLTPVLPALELLARHVSEGDREDVEMVYRNVELEARLIDDLLDVTSISRGKIELHREPLELSTVLRRAAEVCAPDIEARRLHFGIKVEAGPYPVDADPARLQQVFWNLIKNAVKFTPHGGCVGIHCRSSNGHVLAEVKDSGMGIEPEALARIFNAFEQVDRSVTRQFGGLGLGLAISKTLVELHGGTLQARSEGRGKGATFTVKLPIYKPAEGARPSRGPEHPPFSTQAPAPARPLHILLVEDHGDTARILRRILQTKGHTVETAGDVATALALVRETSFDLLLSDLGLPDRSGLELMRELREQGGRMPGIALSGYGQEEDVRGAKEAGFAEHLTKPVNFAQLEAAINRVPME